MQAGHLLLQRGDKLEMEKGYFSVVQMELSLNFNEPIIVACLLAVNPPMWY